MIDHLQICYDFQEPLEIRMKYVKIINDYELNELIECLCSSYNIHPRFLCLEYLYALIMFEGIDLQRRIRIAESCDLYSTLLFLLHKQPFEKRINIIETFNNKYLKLHSYYVLYTIAPNFLKNTQELNDCRIQIMKNRYNLSLGDNLDWFENFLDSNKTINTEYKNCANCSDFILIKTEDLRLQKKALEFLGITSYKKQFVNHKENVHLFAPKQKLLDKIFSENSAKSCNILEIINFIKENNYNLNFFTTRIINDKTTIGSLSKKYTLEEIICLIWNQLTNDLKHLLIKDLESSMITGEEGWSCTTGYYNRIINIYQSCRDQDLFEFFTGDIKLEFITKVRNFIDDGIKNIIDEKEQETILNELPNSSDEKRITYLTFKITKLPIIMEKLREEYVTTNIITEEQYDEFFSHSIRVYEDAL
jgi:hypothetical protein